jgi:hypothetical protein
MDNVPRFQTDQSPQRVIGEDIVVVNDDCNPLEDSLEQYNSDFCEYEESFKQPEDKGTLNEVKDDEAVSESKGEMGGLLSEGALILS